MFLRNYGPACIFLANEESRDFVVYSFYTPDLFMLLFFGATV